MTEVSLKRAPYLLPHRRNVFSFRLVFQQSGKLSENHQVGAENYGCAFTGDAKPVVLGSFATQIGSFPVNNQTLKTAE